LPTLDHPLLSIVAFAIMVSAASAPLLRYLGLFDALPAVRAQTAGHVSTSAAPAASAFAPSPIPAKTAHEVRVAQLAELDRTLPKDPKAAALLLMKAANERRAAGDVVLAELMLARALEHDEESPELAFAFAEVRKAQGNLEGAEGWVLKALRVQPRNAAYRTFYAQLLSSLGKPREAARELRRAKALAP
jgi:tetratricopeptide (TPR) repeat protein